MYLVKYKPGKTFIPCTSISWLTGDNYICDISFGEKTTINTKTIIADASEIFPIEVYTIAQYLVESQWWGNSNWREGGRIEVSSLKNKSVEKWYLYKGGLFTDMTELGEGYFTQFIVPQDILSTSGIIMYNDPVIPTGRIIIEPAVKPRAQEQKFTLSNQHKLILEFIDKNGPSTTFTISDGLNLPVSSVAGRVSELSRQGKLKCVSVDYSTGVKRKIWGDENHKSWL